MSTKTLRKRIALVAVAGLGFGLLSATTASADIALGDVSIVAPTAGSLTSVGVCSVAAEAQDGAQEAVNSGTVVVAGAVLVFKTDDTTAADGGSLSITGPAIWSDNDGSLINATATKLTEIAAGNPILKTTGVGSVTVVAKNDAGASVASFGISVVASCSSSTTPVAANTLLEVKATQDQSDGEDDTLTYGQKDYGSTVWVNIALRNAYKGDVAAGLLTATATNGALIAFDGDAMLTSSAFKGTAADSDDAMGLSVSQDTDTNPGKALTTTITFAFNGVTVGTKSVTILGVAASITVSDVVGGTTDGAAGEFEYVVKDNAGNSVESPAHGGITGTIAGITFGDVVTDASAATDYDSPFTTKGTGTFDCATASTKSSGSQEIAIGFLNSSLTLIKSNTFKASCGLDATDTYSVSLDKASYGTGDIATLTITAKDALGAAVADGTVLGAAAADVAADLAGMTGIGTLIAETATFSGGVKTYKFRVDQNTGNFVGQVKVKADTDTAAKTLQYSITSSSSGVSNADVLKAIVSLIASINKQIAALQKALLKKK